MSSVKRIDAKYFFLDIVGYSLNRSVEAQTDIINVLNENVKEATNSFRLDGDQFIFFTNWRWYLYSTFGYKESI